ncbi:hypothetical protein CGK42_20560 [Vibrio parahaemolyticus]|nr:hypothetical protein CGK42_20560 [Vibrio parahaemolyticus]
MFLNIGAFSWLLDLFISATLGWRQTNQTDSFSLITHITYELESLVAKCLTFIIATSRRGIAQTKPENEDIRITRYSLTMMVDSISKFWKD